MILKRPFYIFAILAASLTLAGTACKKVSSVAPNAATPLQDLINTDTSLQFFHTLLLKGNEAELLKDDTVTLLIPTNAAFRSAGWQVDSLGSTDASRMVRYWTIKGIAQPSTSDYTAYNTTLGYAIYGMKDDKIWFNGVTIIGDTLRVGKALVYKLSAPVFPAYDSVMSLAADDSTLTIFHEALGRSGLDTTLLPNHYTILAPNNNAWISAGYDSPDAIDNADSATIVNIVKNHIFSGSIFTNNFATLTSLTSLQGNTISISTTNGTTQFAGTTGTPAKLLNGNIVGGNNFVVHRIDQLLK